MKHILVLLLLCLTAYAGDFAHTLKGPLKVGSCGLVPNVMDNGQRCVTVVQVLNSRRILADVPYLIERQETTTIYRNGQAAPHAQTAWLTEYAWVIIDNIETEGIADDTALQISKPLKITGTTQYRTVLGSTKTVFVATLTP